MHTFGCLLLCIHYIQVYNQNPGTSAVPNLGIEEVAMCSVWLFNRYIEIIILK